MTYRLTMGIIGMAAVVLAGPMKKSKDLVGRSPKESIPVIVQYRQGPSQADVQHLTAKGGRIRNLHPKVRSISVTLSAAALDELAADPAVTYISPDRPIHGAMDYTVPTTGADLASGYGYEGSGVTVAVIDSGIAGHPDLRDGLRRVSRVVYRESFLPGAAQSAIDRYGHGTHVAGIIGGDGWASATNGEIGPLRGIAPKVRLVDLQVLDENGIGTDSAVIAALERAIELRDVYGIRVINLSLGRPVMESYTLDPLCQAVEAAWKAGITVVVAAGNDGRGGFPGSDGYWTVTAPGNDPYAITVGAMKTMATPGRGDDLVASYSSKGPSLIDQVVKPDLVAPGNRVTSLLSAPDSTLAGLFPENVRAASPGKRGGAQYFQLSGTSMAAAVVSGAAALLLEESPQLTPDQVKVRLMKTATKTFPQLSMVTDNQTQQVYRSQYDIFTIGAGYLDIPGALQDGSLPEGSALSLFSVLDATGAVELLASPTSAWVQTFRGWLPSVWGTSVIASAAALPEGGVLAWGQSAAWGNPTVWDASVAWGASIARADSVAWGESAAWGASVERGEN